MPSVDQLRNRLIKKLRELFQLDQPDLDFGFYRIMHAKADHVSDFIKNDLLKIIENAFGGVDESRKSELMAAYNNAVHEAREEYNSPDPENTPNAKKLKAELDAVKDTATAEGDIYDHLYRFFERYYDTGDFVSRRYYTRETSDKAAPYAIPYNGEEVKLHWANADQYYIKSAEYFTNFTFDLRKAKEVIESEEGLFSNSKKDDTRKVHFRIVDAVEGEHGNVKASDATKRFFILHQDKPIESTDDGELIVNFEYRPLANGYDIDSETEKRLKKEYGAKNKGDLPQIAMADIVLQELNNLDISKEYLQLLSINAQTEKITNRPLLAKYIRQYTARNTMDYFIHKDLGSFLRRELDFYIKNEVMRLDDIEDADEPAVETWLSKIKVLRTIAAKLIDFLAQLEDFQKKLWLKKKFVIETNYCITLDRAPEELYPEIAANQAQHDEWVKLFAIDEIQLDVSTPAYSNPLTEKFLKANDKLVLDTQFFDYNFKSLLIASIENFDEQCNGLLIHSENFQALNLIKERFEQQIRATYIDPPYNTVHSEIIYKNQYKHSSWLSLIANVASVTPKFWLKTFSFGLAIDDYEFVNLAALLDGLFPNLERSIVVINHHPQGAGGRLSRTHEYLILCSPSNAPSYLGKPKDDYLEERSFMRSGTAENNYRYGRWKSFYALLLDPTKNIIVDAEEPIPLSEEYTKSKTVDGYRRIYPINSRGEERVWRSSFVTGKKRAQDGELIVSDSGTVYQTIDHDGKRETLFSNWTDKKFNAGIHGSNILGSLGLGGLFDYPKSIFTVETALWAQTYGDYQAIVLDYFAGSGTTGHAVVNLNRNDNGKRKYILVEMGDYFNTVLKPRISKVVYSENWKDGKPSTRDTGISHCFKYLRLESYEDTLNNLCFDGNSAQRDMLAASPSLKEDFMLNYLLDVETRGSQSLLNIDAFSDPTAYTLNVKKPGSDEIITRNIDLMETFNYLIGLRVNHMAVPLSFNADFKRIPDLDLPEDQHTKLLVDGNIKQDENGPWWFRKIEGCIPKDFENPNNGQQANILIVWRKLTGDLGKDNAVLDSWFQKNRISTRDFEFDIIYVNGSNNLPNLQIEGDTWKVRLIEEEFMKRMWDVEGV